MNPGTRLLCGFVLWSVLLGGCSLTKPRPEVRHYALVLTVPEAPSSAAKLSLIVSPFNARDPYGQDLMIYRPSPYRLDFYNYHRWAAAPAELVTDWTRRYVRGAGLFAKVFPATEGTADWILGGVIQQFAEVDHEQSWEAVLSIDFWITRADQHSPSWFQSYTATQGAEKRNPEAIAEAMSRNLENILGRLTADLAPVVAASTAP
jgi:ABC-type uncharacterized transport system auxiliary subunit